MHGKLRIVAFALIFSLFGGLTLAQVVTTLSTSVTSATVPINVLPAGTKKTFCIRERAAGANPVLCFAYNGAIPTAIPTASAVQEISAGSPFCDALPGVQDTAINEPWACVLETGVTAVTVDATWR